MSATAQEQSLNQAVEQRRRQALAVQRARIAWLAIGSSFVLFCLLCAGAIFGGYWYASNAPETHGANIVLSHGRGLEIKRAGTTTYVVSRVVAECEENDYSPLLCVENLAEGDAVRTGPDSDASVDLFDGSKIQLNYDTEIRLERLRSSRFFNAFKDILIHVERGSIMLSTADPYRHGETPIRVTTLPHTRIQVHASSVTRVAVLETESGCGVTQESSLPPQSGLLTPCTQAIADFGRSDVIVEPNQHFLIEARPDYSEMARVGADGKFRGPERAEENLIAHGDFVKGATAEAVEVVAGWRRGPIRSSSPGTARQQQELIGGDDNWAVQFVRPIGAPGQLPLTPKDIDRTSIIQDVNRGVSTYKSLELAVQVKIVEQSGISTESGKEIYPLTVRVYYEDSQGNPRTWSRSFYYGEVAGAPPESTRQLVRAAYGPAPKEVFYLQDENYISAIRSIEIEASGYTYDVWVQDIKLIGR